MPILDTVQASGSDGRVLTGTPRRGKTSQIARATVIDPFYYAENLSDKVAPPGENVQDLPRPKRKYTYNDQSKITF